MHGQQNLKIRKDYVNEKFQWHHLESNQRPSALQLEQEVNQNHRTESDCAGLLVRLFGGRQSILQ